MPSTQDMDLDGRWRAYPLTVLVERPTHSVDHSLICKLGGYTSIRHNSAVRDRHTLTSDWFLDPQFYKAE